MRTIKHSVKYIKTFCKIFLYFHSPSGTLWRQLGFWSMSQDQLHLRTLWLSVGILEYVSRSITSEISFREFLQCRCRIRQTAEVECTISSYFIDWSPKMLFSTNFTDSLRPFFFYFLYNVMCMLLTCCLLARNMWHDSFWDNVLFLFSYLSIKFYMNEDDNPYTSTSL